MNLQKDKLDVFANSIKPKGSRKIKKAQPKRWKQPCIYSVLYEIKTQTKGKQNNMEISENSYKTVYVVKQLLNRVFFFL